MSKPSGNNPFTEQDHLSLRSLVHDVNNLITVIRGNITLAREQLETVDSVQNNLAAAEKAAGQLRPLVGQLAALNQPLKVVEVTEAEPLARECMSICLANTQIKGALEAESGLLPVAMERGSVARILNNLLINAREAMPQGGEVVLRLFSLGEIECPRWELSAGDYICFELEDNGPGIAPSALNRIFEANYSEKIWGQGLGLYGSRILAEAKGGALTASSEEGEGAIFRLFLPIAGVTVQN